MGDFLRFSVRISKVIETTNIYHQCLMDNGRILGLKLQFLAEFWVNFAYTSGSGCQIPLYVHRHKF